MEHSLLPYQVVSLGFFLSKSCRNWKELNLYNCNIGDHGINLLHRYLCGGKISRRKITTVDLGGNSFTGISSPLIADIVTYLQPHTLILGQNNITNISDLSTAVKNTNTIKNIYMHTNNIIAQEALSNMITYLRELHIYNNRLGNDGAQILSLGITVTTTLKLLDINKNKITAPGATAIASGLLYNQSLEVLIMGNNAIGRFGVMAIADAITNNKVLKKLSLYDDDTIDEDSGMIMMRCLQFNNSITELRFPGKLLYTSCAQKEVQKKLFKQEIDILFW